ncbi:SRPBCC domain-containing protein [Amorphoplanes nipponensis]|uniref:Activator of HSP90 ATPase n=1 Tax=Actinoplanes nipponensis TaxID=135950 RepID=A0A919MMZ0_9ACTN|nr:SRPBCC domain-containing protein [Actinoplanes nipponensis]GIE50407.1 activator of HSP90 ATPase [Actinoplanes nipponensis]
MVDILHKVGVQAPPAAVFAALTTVEGLAGWWTTDTRGRGDDPGGVLEFRFGPGGIDMKVVELAAGRRVTWEVVGGPEEWIGTRVEWRLEPDQDYTGVLFAHRGWREPVEFMHHCSTKWATYLMSLKSLIETGTGAPDPHDVKVDNWN